MRPARFAIAPTIVLAAALAVPATRATLHAQQATQPEPAVARLAAEPTQVNLRVGDSLAFKVTAYDASGKELPDAVVPVGGPRMAVEVTPRDVRRRITVTGRGNISTTHTSDFWPLTGKDGRDYAIVVTWGGTATRSCSTSRT